MRWDDATPAVWQTAPPPRPRPAEPLTPLPRSASLSTLGKRLPRRSTTTAVTEGRAVTPPIHLPRAAMTTSAATLLVTGLVAGLGTGAARAATSPPAGALAVARQ